MIKKCQVISVCYVEIPDYSAMERPPKMTTTLDAVRFASVGASLVVGAKLAVPPVESAAS